jgi:hypothetical protein
VTVLRAAVLVKITNVNRRVLASRVIDNMRKPPGTEGSSAMTTSELRFRSPGWAFYRQGLGLAVIDLFIVAMVVIEVVNYPRSWTGPVVVAVLGLLCMSVFMFTWFVLMWEANKTWRQWRQFRPPAVLIDDAGVRYLAARGPVLIPWADIEEILVKRTLRRAEVVTKVSLRLAPGAVLLMPDGVKTGPVNRNLNIGRAADMSVSESVALDFLSETAGSRVRVTEDFRRTSADPNIRR